MKELHATLLGFIVAPFVRALILSVAYPLSGDHSLGSTAASLVVAVPFSAIFTIGLGLPAFLILRRFGPGNWWSVGAAGFLLGGLTAFDDRPAHRRDLPHPARSRRDHAFRTTPPRPSPSSSECSQPSPRTGSTSASGALLARTMRPPGRCAQPINTRGAKPWPPKAVASMVVP